MARLGQSIFGNQSLRAWPHLLKVFTYLHTNSHSDQSFADQLVSPCLIVSRKRQMLTTLLQLRASLQTLDTLLAHEQDMLLSITGSSSSALEEQSLASFRDLLSCSIPHGDLPPLLPVSRSSFLDAGVTENQVEVLRRRMVMLLLHLVTSFIGHSELDDTQTTPSEEPYQQAPHTKRKARVQEQQHSDAPAKRKRLPDETTPRASVHPSHDEGSSSCFGSHESLSACFSAFLHKYKGTSWHHSLSEWAIQTNLFVG